MNAAEQATAVRRGAGLFAREDRGLVAVSGTDRVGWLNGMISGDVAPLGEGPDHSGCPALLLTAQGRIVADLHVLWRPDALWLAMDAEAAVPVCARLEKYVIADDVEIGDRSAGTAHFALEGPRAGEILAAAMGRDPGRAPGACVDAVLGGAEVLVTSLGVSGECAFEILAPRARSADVASALGLAGGDRGLVTASADALEILRIEAGVPRYRAELDESVLPDEARLDAAVSTTKGCYTGQEVVARIRSRGQVAHLLIGIAFEGDTPVAPDTPVTAGGRRVGEVTSACVSPAAGSFALAFARRSDARAGREVDAAGRRGRVVELPFVAATPS